MELKNHIQLSSVMMITSLKIVNAVEIYGDKKLNFVYGMNERHGSFKRMFKELKRIIWQKR
jgi:hypothetical protein|tara:strand:+ start:3165 stop:3347 length:183 start_codon:yes stop_codon:yes gene_type:complete